MLTKTKTKISKSLKKHHEHKRIARDISKLVGIICFYLIVYQVFMTLRPVAIIAEENVINQNHLPLNAPRIFENEREAIIAEINKKTRHSPILASRALAIAECESGFNPNAKNPNSTAKGLYQFINKTWANYCEGDVFNYQDSIDCFIKLYPVHPDWWACEALTS